jgi:beta-galactosidase/beta-glucuronidase
MKMILAREGALSIRSWVFPSLIFLLFSLAAAGQGTTWNPAGDKIRTAWADSIDPVSPLPEYPRPQMERDLWISLNGLWDYAIVPGNSAMPAQFEGRILVPFAVESSLSGVARKVGVDSVLWYRTRFTVPKAMKGKTILLHFGAVDWESDIFIDGKKVLTHSGGYDPFYVDITSHLRSGGGHQLDVRVADPVDRGPQPRGKQVSKPEGIWYTSVTGIWQTVWLEAVSSSYISSTRHLPDIDNKSVTISVTVENPEPGDMVRVKIIDGANTLAATEVPVGTELKLPVDNPRLWSPDDPFLYDLNISLVRKGKVTDEVKSYFAMRKISVEPDVNGVLRMMLNNRFVFQYGTLDQGWWPDGLYTAPTDEALLFDIAKTKEMGFNMIRKHVKVEPARWYYHCDRTGMLVWQDMPSGDLGGHRWNDKPGMEGGSDKSRTEASEKIYKTEWNAIIDCLYNFPSIVVWVPFNEAWGQFKTAEITQWTKEKDPSRLVNSASGGNFHDVGDILDVHNYPGPVMPKPEIFGKKQVLVLGEFGGLGLPLEDHTWLEKNNWGYRSFRSSDTLFMTYSGYLDQITRFVDRGLSAAIYTQTTDVEIETNGLMTYDRKVVKLPVEGLRETSRRLYEAGTKVRFRK